MSGEIEIETGLTGYLDKDAAVVETSRQEWEPEYNALSRLVDIFRRMSQLVVVKDKNLSLPSQLFLVVLNQSYGVASELLRRRTTDAQGLMRRAVEAAGVAHRLWKHPELTEVFNEPIPTSTMISILDSLDLAYPVGCQMGDPMLNFRHGPPWFSDDAPRISTGIS